MKSSRSVMASLVFAAALNFAQSLHAQLILVNIAHTNDGGIAQGIALAGSYAYLAAGSNGLYVYDVSNPARPVKAGHADSALASGAYHLAISGNYAYVTSLSPGPGFAVYDISRPSNPSNVFKTNYNLFGSLAVLTTNLYIGGDSRVPVFNISTPANPTFVSAWINAGNPTSISVSGNLFAGIAKNFLEVSTLFNGFQFTNGFGTNLGCNAESVVLSGPYAFITENTNSPLACYLISSNRATLLSRLTYPATNSAGPGYDLALSGAYAYFGCASGVRIVNISNPTNLVPVVSTPSAFGGVPHQLAVSGQYVYLANGTDGLRVFQTTPPLTVTPLKGGHLLIMWLADGSFALQEKALTATNWVTLTNIPTLIGNSNEVTLPLSGSGAFFRLVPK